MPAELRQVKTLLGHKGLSFSIECLQSFVNCCNEPLQLKIFEDGSLTAEDRQLLGKQLPGCEVIDMERCSQIVFQKLQNFPTCLFFRERVLYARKIFDLLLCDDADCLYIDSDIYFIKKFSLPAFGNTPVFMYDSQNGYPFTPFEFFKIKNRIYPNINSGFFFFPQARFSLQYIESLLKNPLIFNAYHRGLVAWLEQSIWAFMASHSGEMYYFNTHQVVMATEKLVITPDTVCVHLVSTYRNQLERVKQSRVVDSSTAYTPLTTTKAKSFLKAHHFFIERMIKRFRRFV